MTAAVALLAKARGGPAFRTQVLFYPVTDASFETGSYQRFAEGYFLRRDAMQWFWDQYTPDPAQRAEITASPLRAAARLRAAGVPVTAVRYLGAIHDFVMLNALRETHAAEAAIAHAVGPLSAALAAKV